MTDDRRRRDRHFGHFPCEIGPRLDRIPVPIDAAIHAVPSIVEKAAPGGAVKCKASLACSRPSLTHTALIYSLMAFALSPSGVGMPRRPVDPADRKHTCRRACRARCGECPPTRWPALKMPVRFFVLRNRA